MNFYIKTSIILLLMSFLQPKEIKCQNEYSDLLVLYVDGKYEKCLKKSLKYTEKDDTRRDALPYLYAAKSYYEMSRDFMYNDDHPRAYKNALSFLSKYRKKDKAFIYKRDSEQFIEKIKMEVAEEIENYELSGTEKDYRKTKSLLKKLHKIDPDDFGIELLLGVHYIKSNDKNTGKKIVKSTLKKWEEIEYDFSFGEMTASQQYFLKEALISFFHYQHKKDPEEARSILLFGESYFNHENDSLEIENIEDYEALLESI